jgi:hypothetical protein
VVDVVLLLEHQSFKVSKFGNNLVAMEVHGTEIITVQNSCNLLMKCYCLEEVASFVDHSK